MKLLKYFLCKISGKRELKEKIDFSQVSSILINPIGDAIGDTMIHTAHIKQIKSANPHIKIGIFASTRNRVLFEQANIADIILEKNLINAIKQRKQWDLLIDFQPNFTSSWLMMTKIISPTAILIFNKDAQKYYNLNRIKNYDYYCDIPAHIHMVDYLKHSLLSDFIDHSQNNYILGKLFDNQPEEELTKPITIVVAPLGSSRKIPSQELQALLNAIPPTLANAIKIILSADKAYFQEVKAKLARYLKLTHYHAQPLSHYLNQLNQANIVVSVDSGTVHLACAFEKPLLAFYANNKNNIHKWSPKVADGVNWAMIISNNPAGGE